MDDKLPSSTPAHNAHISLENESNSAGAIASRPEKLATRKPLLDGVLEKHLPSGLSQGVKEFRSAALSIPDVKATSTTVSLRVLVA
jgi:hypothetical protein